MILLTHIRTALSGTHTLFVHTLFLGLLFLASCGIIKPMILIKSKEIKPVYFNTDTKKIILVPNTHFGQPDFYADLTDSIKHWKNNGYRIYYEQIRGSKSDPSFETNERKWRRITGGMGNTPDDLEELKSVFKKGMIQPPYTEMGITKDDLNADVHFSEFIDKYEELYGVIELNPCDLETPFDSAYSCYKPKRAMAKLEPVIVGFRNEKVVQYIEENNDPKVVVLYGAGHIKEILEILKKKY